MTRESIEQIRLGRGRPPVRLPDWPGDDVVNSQAAAVRQSVAIRMAVLGLGPSRLAWALGTTPSAVSQMYNGALTAAKMSRLSRALGLADWKVLLDPRNVVTAPLPPEGWFERLRAAREQKVKLTAEEIWEAVSGTEALEDALNGR